MASTQSLEARGKFFTVEEANKALPLVERIVSDIVRQYRIVQELGQRLKAVMGRDRRRTPGDPYWEELAQTQAEMETEESKLRDYLDELTRLGVQFKGPDGLCDFPSLRDGREICLCWRLGEPEVAFWHEIDAGFAGRQPLKGPSARGRAHAN
jgi:hypothetical protein